MLGSSPYCSPLSFFGRMKEKFNKLSLAVLWLVSCNTTTLDHVWLYPNFLSEMRSRKWISAHQNQWFHCYEPSCLCFDPLPFSPFEGSFSLVSAYCCRFDPTHVHVCILLCTYEKLISAINGLDLPNGWTVEIMHNTSKSGLLIAEMNSLQLHSTMHTMVPHNTSQFTHAILQNNSSKNYKKQYRYYSYNSGVCCLL